MRERVLPWYKGEGTEMGNTSFFRYTQSIFFMLGLLRRASFWPPSRVYISVMYIQTLQITFLHVGWCTQSNMNKISHLSSLSLNQGNILSLMSIPILTFRNCIQIPMTFACLSWDVRFKKTQTYTTRTYINGETFYSVLLGSISKHRFVSKFCIKSKFFSPWAR